LLLYYMRDILSSFYLIVKINQAMIIQLMLSWRCCKCSLSTPASHR